MANEEKASVEFRVERAEANLDRIIAWVWRHNYRTAFLFGAVTLMYGYNFEVIRDFTGDCWALKYWALFLFGIITALYGIIVYLLFLSIKPDVNPKKDSYVFFGTISQMEQSSFVKEVRDLDCERYLEDVLCQVHRNAEIVTKKFSLLSRAFYYFAVFIGFWFLFIGLATVPEFLC